MPPEVSAIITVTQSSKEQMDTLTCDLSRHTCNISTPTPIPSGGTNLNYGFAFLVVNF